MPEKSKDAEKERLTGVIKKKMDEASSPTKTVKGNSFDDKKIASELPGKTKELNPFLPNKGKQEPNNKINDDKGNIKKNVEKNIKNLAKE